MSSSFDITPDIAPDVRSDITTLAVPPPPPPVDLIGLALAGLKPSSAEGYRKDLRAFADWSGGGAIEPKLWGLLRLDQGAANALGLAFAADQLRRGLSPATVRRRNAALVRVIDRARRIGLTSLTLEVDLPRAEALRDTAGPGKRGWKQILDRAELEVSAAAMRGPNTRARAIRNLAILLLLHDRAVRRSELAGLDLADYDPARPAIAVVGKGKTSKEWLTISSRSSAAVAAWVEARGREDGPLFTQLHNGTRTAEGRLSDWSVNELVKAVAGRAGLTRTVTAHALRHQSITEALDHYDVRDVRHFSRHAKIDTVLVYDDRKKDMGGVISEAIAGKRRRR